MTDVLNFAPEVVDDPVLQPPWEVLVVDDEPQVHSVTTLALKGFSYDGRPLKLLHAYSARDAKEMLKHHGNVAAILLDVVMETDHAGLDVVEYVRDVMRNRLVRIILRTGQPGRAPEDQVIRSHAINDYRHKTELTRQRLATTLYAALATYNELKRMDADEAVKRVRQEALKLVRTKSELLDNVSHELRTPMNGVVGMTEILLDSALTPEQRDAAETIRFSADSLMKIFNDMFDLKRIEEGSTQLDLRELDPRALIAHVLDTARPLAAPKGIALNMTIDDRVPSAVWGDPAHLRQVLSILVSNAVKFTDRGEVRVSAAMTRETSVGVTVRFSVRDTGIGIAPEARSKLFTPFTQADTSSTRRHGGLGLGLAICQHLVNLMGGDISVESEVGKGSTFVFSLTLARASSRDAIEPSPQGGVAPSLDPPLRVLVAEDDPINRKVADLQLRQCGILADFATDGAQVLDALSHQPYDIVLMDCQLPKLDGYETTSRIRARSGAQGHVWIVAMTASVMVGARDRCLSAGMNDYLAKPVTGRSLREVLDRFHRNAVKTRS